MLKIKTKNPGNFVTPTADKVVPKVKSEPISEGEEPVTVIMSKAGRPKRAAAAKAVLKEEPDWLSDEGEC